MGLLTPEQVPGRSFWSSKARIGRNGAGEININLQWYSALHSR
jgi:hypothetical protein